MANWFGKGKKGLIFGIWNAHTSIGNILGGILAGIENIFNFKIFENFDCKMQILRMLIATCNLSFICGG